MIREGKSSPCYEGQHEKCRVVYSGRRKLYNSDKAVFYEVQIAGFPCGCECHREVTHAAS